MPSTFTELGLNDLILAALTELGYEEPTPIQAQTIPVFLEGIDVIAQAQTGTGKTAAFALPILQRLNPDQRTPQALILTPTRELAIQVAEAFHSYSKNQRYSVLPVYGGQPIDRQLRALERGVQVVVGTPGRLVDHIRRGTLKLGEVKTVVLDEADEMLAMGFQDDMETILKQTPKERQTALFSATMPAPIVALSRKYMRDARRVTAESEQMTVPQIRQVYYEVGRRDKFEVLARVLDFERPTSAIIFCRTKKDVDTLGERLTARAYPAETLHGDLNQAQRDRVMARFRNGQAELLIATDVAARGLDVEHVSHVVNYDIPLAPDSYVHRIGRTGRAGRTGIAITLVTPRELRLWQSIQRTVGITVQRQKIPTITDVIGRQQEAFKETLRETIAQNNLEQFLVIAEELGEEFSPTTITAAALKMLMGSLPDNVEDTLAVADEPSSSRGKKPATGRDGRDGRESRDGRDGRTSREPRTGGTGDRARRDTQPMTRLYLDVGREDGVRPADIVGAIANEAEIPGRTIGAIEIFDDFVLVDVPAASSKKVIAALKRTTIRNRKLNPSVVKPQKATE